MDKESLSKLTVPQLKKMLTERGLATTGVKAELVARLEGAQGDSVPTESAAVTQDATTEGVTGNNETAPAGATTTTTATATTETSGAPTTSATGGESTTASTFTSNETMDSTDPLSELEKRQARAKRFGIDDSDAAKQAERVKRFGGAESNASISRMDRELTNARRLRGRGGRGGRGGQRGGRRFNKPYNRNNNNNNGPALKFSEEDERKKQERAQRFNS